MFQWIESLHIVFMVCWFAGIFYLPRIFVYYASSDDQNTRATLRVMARKLFYFVTPFALFTIICGFVLFSHNASYYAHASWLKLKLLLVFALILYHASCYYYLRKIINNQSQHSSKFFRFYNELPVFLLFAIVILVVVKPFS